MNQVFSPEQLMKLCKKTEILDSGFTKDELLTQLGEVCSNIFDGNFEFNLTPLFPQVLSAASLVGCYKSKSQTCLPSCPVQAHLQCVCLFLPFVGIITNTE